MALLDLAADIVVVGCGFPKAIAQTVRPSVSMRFGGGCTIGLAMTFGYIAALAASGASL